MDTFYMENMYHVTREEGFVLEMSSVLEDAVYILSEDRGMPSVDVRSMGNSTCRSSKSTSPCRATSVEYRVDSE